MVDIFAHVTSLVGSINQVGDLYGTEETASRRRRLLKVCISADQSLQVWEARFGRDIARKLPRPSSDTCQTLSGMNPFTVQELAAARLMSIYWMTGMVLGEALQDLRVDDEMSLGLGESDASLLMLHTDAEECFRRLVGTFPIFFEPAAGEFRMSLAATPMTLALRHLPYLRPGGEYSKERGILTACLGTPQGQKVRLMVLSLMQT